LSLIEEGALNGRNFVKKVVNWALRQIGKKNAELNRDAINCARRIADGGNKPSVWVESNALREFESEAVQNRIRLNDGRCPFSEENHAQTSYKTAKHSPRLKVLC